MINIPKVKIGIVAVSRDCFPEELAIRRLKALVQAYESKYDNEDIYECPVCIIESEHHMERAKRALAKAECNALCIYLGNFGPEISETMLAKEFQGPVMLCGAAEESQNDLYDGRGDAYCGMLNASYNLRLRNQYAYIPPKPIGTAEQCAAMINGFIPIARAVIGVKNLKIISFGPRPQNFMACNAPIQPLYDLGVEIEENSELDLLEAFEKHKDDQRIGQVVKEMEEELGDGNCIPDILPKLAQYEITLLDWVRTHKGSRKYVALTSKCWPAFQTKFGFVPCYVNSRLTAKGIPVSCEVDIYGTLSEFIGTCITQKANTILDINNTVPEDMFASQIKGKKFEHGEYSADDVFMAFHCGNTSACLVQNGKIKNQRIMARSLPPEVTKGTIEGDLKPSDVTLFRVQGTSRGEIKAYAVHGEILPVATKSFGTIGVFGVHEMARFYRYGLIENSFPHHAAIAFEQCGAKLFETYRYLGVTSKNIIYNKSKEHFYDTENIFELEEGAYGSSL